MAGGTGGASGRVTLGAVLIAGAWIVAYWLTPAPGSPDVEVEFGPPPQTAPHEPPPVITPSETVALPPPTAPQTPPITPEPEPKPPAETTSAEPSPSDLPRIVPPKFQKYVSAEGDTFAIIASKFLKDPDKWTIIAQANPLTDPNKLRPGTVVLIPMDPENIQGRENLAGYQLHTVKSGDSLSSISKQYYGKASLWGVIAAANPDTDPDTLKLGAKLKIPPAPRE